MFEQNTHRNSYFKPSILASLILSLIISSARTSEGHVKCLECTEALAVTPYLQPVLTAVKETVGTRDGEGQYRSLNLVPAILGNSMRWIFSLKYFPALLHVTKHFPI